MNNLELWEKGRRPDPDHLKWVGVGRGYTTAEAQYQVEKATALFGPYGIGWGIDELVYDVITNGNDPIMVILKGQFWYKYQDQDGRFPMVTCKTWSADDDLMKKVATDLQSKCLSKIGIDADLFKGLWGKAGSKKPVVDKVVYLGADPANDIPSAKKADISLCMKLMDELDDTTRGKAVDMMEAANWNHFAVRLMIAKLEAKKQEVK